MKLKGAREALAADLGGKYHAIDVDSTALGINEQSSGLRKRFIVSMLNFTLKLFICSTYQARLRRTNLYKFESWLIWTSRSLPLGSTKKQV